MPLETKTEHLMFVDDPNILIEHFGMDVDEARELQLAWRDWLFEIEKEWPPERVKEWVLEQKRDQYSKTARYVLELEQKNRDARAAGMSFKDREEKYGKKIRIGYQVLAEYKREGLEMKKCTYSIRSYVQPIDYQFIVKEGVEKHLKYAVF